MSEQGVTRRGAMGILAAGLALGAPLTAGAQQGAGKRELPFYNAADFGAVGDGKAKDAPAIQKAIEAAHAAGGGTVVVPNGVYLCGTVRLLDNVTLHLAEGATILGSPDIRDYPAGPGNGKSGAPLALVLAEKARNVALTGRGKVNGQGGKFTVKDGAPGRPHAVKFMECQDVLISDVRVEDSASWVVHLLCCERAVVRGVKVWSHANYNNDGLDIDGCSDVAVAQCHFDCQDDAICLKSTPDKICENIMVSDCFASSHCNLIKFGTSGVGGFRNVTITNCTLVAPRYSQMHNGRQRGIGGINLELVDGGVMDRVAVSNITMDGIELPLFIRLGDRGRKRKKPVGTLKNVVISNIVATNMGQTGSSITGLPGHKVENVTLSNLNFTYEGGGTAADAAKTPQEKPETYPEGFMFGTLPAWGLYCRHVKGLKLHNVKLQLAAADARHAVIFDDVEDLEIDGLDCAAGEKSPAAVRMIQTREVMIRGCRPKMAGTFLKIEGKESGGIALLANDLRKAGKAVETGEDVAKDAVSAAGNLGI